MLPVEWPIAAGAADRPVEPARTAGRDRLAVVRRDLFLDDRARLTEQERALMSAMLGTLVDQLADEIRLGLPTELLAQVEADRQDVASRLWQSGALDRPALILLLLRRTSEQLVAAACRGSRGPDEGGIVDRLVGDSDGPTASAAMSLAVARGRRRDRFGHVGVEFDDVPPTEAHQLIHLVASAIRKGIRVPSVAIDEDVALAAERVFARHQGSRRLEEREVELAEALITAHGANDQLIAKLAAQGDVALIAALCSVRGGVALDTAWALLIGSEARDAMLLARFAELKRPTAAALVAAFAEPLQWGEPAGVIAWFDSLSPHELDAAGRWWRLPPAYRDGVQQHGGQDGQPPN
jgi:hypothetical protein